MGDEPYLRLLINEVTTHTAVLVYKFQDEPPEHHLFHPCNNTIRVGNLKTTSWRCLADRSTKFERLWTNLNLRGRFGSQCTLKQMKTLYSFVTIQLFVVAWLGKVGQLWTLFFIDLSIQHEGSRARTRAASWACVLPVAVWYRNDDCSSSCVFANSCSC